MKEIIEIHPEWLRDERALMRRLNRIISSGARRGNGPFKKKDGYKWQLDGTNDWWAEIEDGKLVLGSRYGGPSAITLVAFCKAWLS